MRGYGTAAVGLLDLVLDASDAVAEGPVVTPLSHWAMNQLVIRRPGHLRGSSPPPRCSRISPCSIERNGVDLALQMDGPDGSRGQLQQVLRPRLQCADRALARPLTWPRRRGRRLCWRRRRALSPPLLAVCPLALVAWDGAPELAGADSSGSPWSRLPPSGGARPRRGPVLSVGRSARDHVDDRLAVIQSSGRPAAAEVAGAVADLTASGVPLAIDQAMPSKVQLKSRAADLAQRHRPVACYARCPHGWSGSCPGGIAITCTRSGLAAVTTASRDLAWRGRGGRGRTGP